MLQSPADTTLTVGTVATIEYVNNGGPGISACTSAPALPAGLTVAVKGDATCEITGTPNAAVAKKQYLISATYTGGASTASVNITVVAAGTGNLVRLVDDFDVINATGEVFPNYITILTWTSTDGATPFATEAPSVGEAGITNTAGLTTKMHYAAPANGEVVVTVTDEQATHSFFTTIFSDNVDVADAKRDLSAYAGGKIIFELKSDDWGSYSAADGMIAKVDHFIEGANFCSCDFNINTTGFGTEWNTVEISLSDLVNTNMLSLENVKTGIVVWPNVNTQRSGAELTFSIRNVRWQGEEVTPATAAPVLTDVTTALIFAQDQDADTITFANTGGEAISTCIAAPTLPAGLTATANDNNSACIISGRPTALAASTEYTVTATNTIGSSAATVTITVIAEVSFKVLDGTGAAGDNSITINTWSGPTLVAAIGRPPEVTNMAGAAELGGSPKMEFRVNEFGEVEISASAIVNTHAYLTTTFSNQVAPATVPTKDHSSFAGGTFKFEVLSTVWGPYRATDGLMFKIDHYLSAEDATCDCAVAIDTNGFVDGQWHKVSIDIDDLVNHATDQLDLTKVKTGMVLWPNTVTQRAGSVVVISVRNARWVADPSVAAAAQ